MSTAAIGSSGFQGEGREGSPARRFGRWAAVLVVVVGLGVLVAWLLGWVRLGVDPRIAEIRKLQSDAQRRFLADGGPQTLDEAKAAVASMQQIRERVEALPEPLRRAAFRQGGNVFRNSMRARINTYFALPPEKRQAELDRQIKQEELFRQAWQQSQPAGGGGGPGAGGAASASTAQGSQPQQAGGSTVAGGPGAPGGPGGPPRGGSEEDRNRWRKEIIDTTSPEQRARYVEYRRAMDARRTQLGLAPWGPR